MANEADRWVVLALLQVAFLGKCDDRGLGPWGWPFSCLSDLVADCRESGDDVLSTSLDQFFWDVVDTSHRSKIMLKITLNRLKPQAEKIIAEEQAGFRAERSTTEQIFNLRILCEKHLQHQQDLYHVFRRPSTGFGMQLCAQP